MAAGSTYTPIATTTLGSAAASYTFSSIPSTYTDLILVTSGLNSAALYVQVGNGSVDSGSNYSYTYLLGDGSTTASGRSSNNTKGFIVLTTGTSKIYNAITHFMNYSNTTTNKTFLTRYSDSENYAAAIVDLWRSTSAINIITIFGNGANIPAGMTFTLYGIQAA